MKILLALCIGFFLFGAYILDRLNSHLTLSVHDNRITLGTWQALYLFEHRLENQTRKIYE